MFVVLKIRNNNPEEIKLFFSQELAYKKYLKLLENSINNEEIEGVDIITDIEYYTNDYTKSEYFINFVHDNINSIDLSFFILNIKVK